MTNHTKNIKKRVMQFLNDATASVMHSYGRYLSADLPKDLDDPPKEPKDFKEFHDAGKSAASHLETLMKLSKAADDPEERAKREQEDINRKKMAAIKKANNELERRR